MEKELKLFANKGLYSDGDKYYRVDNGDLQIRIKNNFGNAELYAIITKGDTTQKIRIENKIIHIAGAMLTPGEINMDIIVVNNGVEIGRYKCIPLVIKELENKVIVIDELGAIKKDLESCKQDFEILKNEMIAELEKLRKITKSFISME